MWFVVGGILLVLAPVVFVGAFYSMLRPLTREDAVFPADGQTHSFTTEAGQERALFSEDGAALQCTATDGNGRQVDFRSVTGEFTYNEWTAVSRFDTGDGDLDFTCTGGTGAEQVRIAQLPSTGGFVTAIVVGVVGPLMLGLAGLVILIITGVLWATGEPRRKGGPPVG